MKVLSIVISILVFILSGCSQTEEVDFADKEWLFYDEVTCEHLCLYFGRDGSYSYHCQCGEPVGDSDLYEKYKYNEDTGIIRISNDYDDSVDEIEVLDYNEYHLMLRIDDEIKDFVLYEHDAKSGFYTSEVQSYLSEYESRCTIVDIVEGKAVCAPVNYDPEGEYAGGPFEEYELSENVQVFELNIQYNNIIRDGEEYEESCEIEFTEVKFSQDMSVSAAFLWFDDEMKVEKIVIWGENSVIENNDNDEL